MRAFMSTFPEGGPSVAQNVATGTLTMTFAFDAEDAKDAVERGVEVFVEGANATGLPATEVLAVEAAIVTAEASGVAPPEPVPA